MGRIDVSNDQHEEHRAGMSSPRRALALVMGALVLGSLFNARSLSNGAHHRAPGWERDLAIGITDPLLDISDGLGLDEPAQWIRDLRTDDGPTEPAGTPRGIFVPTASDPLLLWATGDSLMATVGPSVARAGEATDVISARDEVVYSSGLTRNDFFDWPAHLLEGLAGERSDVVVFMVGANDLQPIETDDGWVGTDAPEWPAAYRQRVAATMDVLAEHTTTAYWVGLPIPRSDSLAAGFAQLNAIYESEAAARPNVRYLDSWPLFTDANGDYSAYLPDESGRSTLVRDDDGVHLTPHGADWLARAIMELIRTDWAVPE